MEKDRDGTNPHQCTPRSSQVNTQLETLVSIPMDAPCTPDLRSLQKKGGNFS